MTARWQLMCAKYDALSLRERALLAVCLLAVLVMIWQLLFAQPLADAQAQVAQDVNQSTQRITTLAMEEASRLQAAAGGQQRSLLQQRDDLKLRLQTLDEELAELSLGLVSAHQLASVLQQVLARADKLELRSLQTLPVEPLNLTTTSDNLEQNSNSRADVYKHSVVIALSGSYFDVLDYLRVLESLNWRFYWEQLDYQQEQYPNGVFELRVFTLSTDEGLLGV